MKIIYNNIIPFPGFKCINLFGFLFARSKMKERDINHEAIHTAQMKELLYIPFYIIYGIEAIFKNYRNISFEKEAYENQDNFEYLKERKHFAMWKNKKGCSN